MFLWMNGLLVSSGMTSEAKAAEEGLDLRLQVRGPDGVSPSIDAPQFIGFHEWSPQTYTFRRAFKSIEGLSRAIKSH